MGLLKKKAEKKEESKPAGTPQPVMLLEAGLKQTCGLGMDKNGKPVFSVELEIAPLGADQVEGLMAQLNDRSVIVIGVYLRDEEANNSQPE